MNKAEIFFDAITNIREELIEEAQNHRFRRRVRWERYAGWAACLALVVCVGWFGLTLARGGMGGSGADSGFSASSGSSAGGEVSGDTAPPPQSPEGSSGGTAVPGDVPELGGTPEGEDDWDVFTATVLEVHEDYILVQPQEDEVQRLGADRVTVTTKGLENLPELEAGSLVEITWNAFIFDTYPLQLGTVYSIELIEP